MSDIIQHPDLISCRVFAITMCPTLWKAYIYCELERDVRLLLNQHEAIPISREHNAGQKAQLMSEGGLVQ